MGGGSIHLPFHRPLNIPLNPGATRQVLNNAGAIRRISLRETTGAAAAVVQLFDGTGTNGVLIGSYGLASAASFEQRYTHGEGLFDGGLFLNLVSGAVEGCITVQPLGPGEPHLGMILALTLGDIATLEGTTLSALAPPAQPAAAPVPA